MQQGIRWLIVLTVVLGVLAPSALLQAQTAERCFGETGLCISGAIRTYWERNGGLPVFGLPITSQRNESVEGVRLTVQWFERDRLEIQPNGQITAGRLGVRRLEQLGRPWQRRETPTSGNGCRSFPETNYAMCGLFRTYWERNGGLERFGFPITDEIEERTPNGVFRVQYFERRRMEFHPENNPPFNVLLGLLGSEVLNASGSPPIATATRTATATATRTATATATRTATATGKPVDLSNIPPGGVVATGDQLAPQCLGSFALFALITADGSADELADSDALRGPCVQPILFSTNQGASVFTANDQVTIRLFANNTLVSERTETLDTFTQIGDFQGFAGFYTEERFPAVGLASSYRLEISHANRTRTINLARSTTTDPTLIVTPRYAQAGQELLAWFGNLPPGAKLQPLLYRAVESEPRCAAVGSNTNRACAVFWRALPATTVEPDGQAFVYFRSDNDPSGRYVVQYFLNDDPNTLSWQFGEDLGNGERYDIIVTP